MRQGDTPYYVNLYRDGQAIPYTIAKCFVFGTWQYELWALTDKRILALGKTAKELLEKIPD